MQYLQENSRFDFVLLWPWPDIQKTFALENQKQNKHGCYYEGRKQISFGRNSLNGNRLTNSNQNIAKIRIALTKIKST